MNIEEIKQDIINRGWTHTTVAQHGGAWWHCCIHDLTIEVDKDLYLAPIVGCNAESEEDSIRKAYARAIEYLPHLPEKYIELSIEYKRLQQ